ncbi:MAG: transposase [Xanthomonadaceae bacterium]|nr:transposase [Xanthomonadaceae bacterium]
MSRPARIVYPGAWYHVFANGNGAQPVFENGEFGAAFLSVLSEVAAATAVEVHAYCLLTDGYHLLLRTPRANLPQMMRQLNGQYAHWCRRDGRRDGRVFDRRYRAVLLDPDGWPLRVSRYIHLEPVRTQLVADPLLYRWSSLRALVGRSDSPPWLTTRTLVRLAGGADAYLAYVGYGVDAETAAFYNRQRISPVLGQPRMTASTKPRASGIEIADIVRRVAEAFSLPPALLYESKRGRGAQATPRAVAMLLARSPGGHSLEAIADALSVQHRSTISVTVRRCRERLKRDNELKERVEAISRRLAG